MSSEPEGEELSVATTEDLQDVLDMSGDVYHGVDYITAIFTQLVQGPTSRAFLYKVKGELVAFTSTKIVDGGQSILFIGSRVKDTYQGRGIYGRFRRKVFEQFSDRKRYPRLQRETVTVHTRNNFATGGRMQAGGWRLFMTRYNPMPVFQASRLHQLTLEKPRHQVTALTSDDVFQLLQADPQHWRHLFPQERIIVGWKPYKIMEDNLHNILDDVVHNRIYVTSSSAPPPQYSILSAGSYYFCNLGTCYLLDIYGEGSVQELKDHINAHLQRLKDMSETLRGEVVFNVFYSERLEELAAEATNELGAYKLKELGKTFEEFYLWERDISEMYSAK